MGCVASTPNDVGGNWRKTKSVGELAVFVPGFRIPREVDFAQPLVGSLPKSLIDRLTALRARIVVMAAQVAEILSKPKQKITIRHGSSTLADVLLALEDYLPVLLGLVKDDSINGLFTGSLFSCAYHLRRYPIFQGDYIIIVYYQNGDLTFAGIQLNDRVQFVWVNQEDDDEQTALANVWYEVLSVLHLMAEVCLAEANILLLRRTCSDGHQPRISEGFCDKHAAESRQRSIDVLVKAAGYLDCAIHHVLPQIPLDLRRNLPVDISEGELFALCMQALGQGIDVQLGIAIDSPKATLAVKRRLACEMVKCWHQAQDSITKIPFISGWGEKHRLFVKWKYAEANAAAYYYHGLILDESYAEKSHEMAIAALQGAEEFLKESKRACEAFNAALPTSRNPPPWGSMKYLAEKIPKDASGKVRTNRDLYFQGRTLQSAAPALPDFAVSLKPDDYQLPPLDPSWNAARSTAETLKL
ncbi:hypothetical protein AXF42_Ash016177 [Apostasia shenzhenica]|uniref:BRO1 domain-containing protein n=1 Tax=Apostasia shenzhenica TaxID=1088818 RepID=A0A2I0AEN3_9ASPA|nr:hypothetical protein AXF42_Ash016177 [Apostasia shenzhenica]